MSGYLTITWLGHGSFLFASPSGKRFLLDPWLERNPSFPAALKHTVSEGIDAIVITHGRSRSLFWSRARALWSASTQKEQRWEHSAYLLGSPCALLNKFWPCIQVMHGQFDERAAWIGCSPLLGTYCDQARLREPSTEESLKSDWYAMYGKLGQRML